MGLGTRCCAARAAAVLALATLLAAAVGCGYRLAGWSGTPALWIEPVEDEGNEPLFGARLTRDLTRETVNKGDARLVARGSAEAVVAVALDEVTESGGAYTAGDRVREYLLAASATVTVLRADGEVVWRSRGVAATREFAGGETLDETERNKERALELLSRDLAREILRRTVLALEMSEP